MTTENNGLNEGAAENLGGTPGGGKASDQSMKGHPMAGPLNNVEQMVESGIQSAISALKKAGVNFDGEASGPQSEENAGPNLTLDPGGPKYEDFDYNPSQPQAPSPESGYANAAQSLGDLAGSRFSREPEPEPQPQPQPQPQTQQAAYGEDYSYSQQPYNQVPAQGSYQGYQPPATQEPREKPKRVGVFTAVAGLVAAGIIITGATMGGTLSGASRLVALAPMLLVLFGAEILICNLLFRGRKLKYDGMAILLCILVAVFGMSGVLNTNSLDEVKSIVSDRANLKNSATSLCNELEDALTGALGGVSDFAGVTVRPMTEDGMILESSEDWVSYAIDPNAEVLANTTIYMNGPYDSPEQFASTAYELLQIAKDVNIIEQGNIWLIYENQSNNASVNVDKSHFFASSNWILDNMDGAENMVWVISDQESVAVDAGE